MNQPKLSNSLWFLTAALSSFILVAISGCASTSEFSGFPSGGYAVKVPVMWVGTEADGTEVGGVEQTEVWTGPSKTAGYEVDLTGVEAEGAGDAWRAASASAATVATLINGTDPARLNIQFHISSPIDGPSAGSILTVGLLASLRGIQLIEHATMTGTISPDGSIGPIGGAFSKVVAAADAGFTTVVIPETNQLAKNPATSETVDLVQVGAGLGITVIPVTQLSQAFEALTGQELFDTPLSTPNINATDLSPQRAQNISHLLEKTTELHNQDPAEYSGLLISEADIALAAGDLDLASGLAREGYLVQWRHNLQNEFSTQAQTTTEQEISFLESRVDAALTRAQDRIAETTGIAGLTDSQYASMPEMLLGVITAQATLESLSTTIPQITSHEEALRAAAIVADQEAAIDVFFEQDFALLSLVRGSKEIESEDPIAFLSNYTNFLIRSGQANMNYLGSVLKTDDSLNQPSVRSFDTAFPVLVELSRIATTIVPQKEELSAELSEAAYALALYVNSGALVTDAQALGLFNVGIGESGDLSENLSSTRASIDSGLETVTATANVVSAQGWDPAYPLAQATAGSAFSRNQLDDSSSTNSVARGLNRLWAASVAVLLMKAAPK